MYINYKIQDFFNRIACLCYYRLSLFVAKIQKDFFLIFATDKDKRLSIVLTYNNNASFDLNTSHGLNKYKNAVE